MQLPAVAALAAPPRWTAGWDRAVIAAAVARHSRAFDPAESLLARDIGGEYHYHTNLRNTRAHPTRDSLEYALMLLETGGEQNAARALKVLERIVALQVTGPDSRWYGIWGYYLEEPPERMSPADWNWADFNGALLLLVHYRHARRLPEALAAAVREAIRHAAYSVKRRNVGMGYTNIAVQGTFVTTAAGEVLDDMELAAYSRDRMLRLARAIDATGSFAEYNSPTYAQVTIANLTRYRMFVNDSEGQAIAGRIHQRAWLHLAKHWHAPTRQLSGPMSRSYNTDIGQPLWLQKALGGAVQFASLREISSGKATASGEVGILDFRCPDELRSSFPRLAAPVEHRELFIDSKPRPVQGTTFMTPAYTLGSVNRGDFWVQRRPLLAYWGGSKRPARFLQLRFMKDDYDFTSALFYSVQQRNCVLAAVCFRSPGGDKHPNLDPIENGEFEAKRLYLQFLFRGVPAGAPVLASGHPAAETSFGLRVPFTIPLQGCRAFVLPRYAAFTGGTQTVLLKRSGDELSLEVELLGASEPRRVRWAQVQEAVAAFTLAFDEPGPDKFGSELSNAGWARFRWGDLELKTSRVVGPVSAQDQMFEEKAGGQEIPVERLSSKSVE